MFSINSVKTNSIIAGMLFCIPAIIYDIYLSIYFMVLFTYIIFFIGSSTKKTIRINEAKQSFLILIFLIPNAIFNLTPAVYENSLLQGTMAINFNVALAFSVVAIQIYLYFTRCEGIDGIPTDEYNYFNKTRILSSFAVGIIEELFLRITLYHIVGYDLNAFILISIVSTTIYQIVKTSGPIDTSCLVGIVSMNTIFTLSLALTGTMAAPVALKILATVGENLDRIYTEYQKGCTYLKGRRKSYIS